MNKMKSKILSLVLAVTLIFSTAAVSFAENTSEEANKLDLEVKSNGSTAVSVGVDKNYKATINLENDIVNQESVTLDLTMTNVASLGVEGTRHADFTFNTGLVSEERALSQYMENLLEFNSATVNGSINGLEFVYDIEGEATGPKGQATGTWVAEPRDLEETRAAWYELASYVHTNTYDNDDSYVFLPSAGYIQIGTELLCFEEGSEGLTLDNLNNTATPEDKTLEDTIRDNVKLVEAKATDDIVVFIPEGTILRVGGSEACAIEDTTIRVNAEGSIVNGKPLTNMRDAEGMYGVVQEALFIVDDVLGAMNGNTIDIEITTANYEAAKEAIADLKDPANVNKESVEKALELFDSLSSEIIAAMPEEEKEILLDAAAKVTPKMGDVLDVINASVENVEVTVSKAGDFNVTWDAVEEADNYTVDIYRNGKLYDSVDTEETSYALSDVIRGLKYTVVVTPSITFEDVVYFGKEGEDSYTSKLSKANLEIKKTKTNAYIKSDDQNSRSFEIYISKDKKFKKDVKKVTVKTTGKKLNKQLRLSKYFKDGKNYVKVRAYTKYEGDTIYGSWSSVKTVKR